MNLLLVAHRVPYPADKGEKIRTFNHLSFLVDQGHNVTVFTPLENNDDLKFATQLSAKLNIRVEHSSLGSRHFRILRGLATNQALSATNFHSQKLQRKLKALIKADKPDAVMCTSSAMAKYVFHSPTAALIKEQNIRLVMDFMDLDSLKWKQYAARKPWPLSLIYKREAQLLSSLESKVLNTFHASLFVSKEEKEMLHDIPELSAKVHVVSNGVDRSAYYPSDQNTPDDDLFGGASPVVLFTGVMDYFPNEDAVIWFADTVWPSVIQKYPQAKFVIAGMRPSRKVSELENRNGIEVTGYLDEILPYYQQADFLVAPFRVARGIQNKVLQAMACALPVLASPEGATGINCVHNEQLVFVNTPEDYIDAIETLTEDQASYQRISQGGLQLVTTQYTWDSENARLEHILEGKLDNHLATSTSSVETLPQT